MQAHVNDNIQWYKNFIATSLCPKISSSAKSTHVFDTQPKESKITATNEHKKTPVSMQPVMSWLIRRTAISICFWTSQHYPLQPGNHLNPISRNPDF
jgi:hypothetical protein